MWTKKEEQTLIRLYAGKSTAEIASCLHKSQNAVKKKAARLGLVLCEDERKKRCSQSARRLHETPMVGSRNPNWKGGRSKDNYYYKKRQKERYPERVKARELAASAVRAGKIQRKPCEVCGDQNSHMHHEDYSKPLDVVFLCKVHHRERHCS